MPVSPYNGIFSQELTPVSAYWFGFIAADGTIGHYGGSSHFGFGLKLGDINCVRQLAVDLGYTEESVKAYESSNRASFQASSKQLVSDLEHLGLMRRKSRKISGSIIPPIHTSHFIRGLFDGDGSIGLHKRPEHNRTTMMRSFMIYGNKPLLEDIRNELSCLGQFSIWTRPSTGVSQLGTGAYSTIKGLYSYLYTDADRYLDRKKAQFDTVVDYRPYPSDIPRTEDGRNLVMIACNLCGKQVWKRKDHIDRSKSNFCSRRCSGLATKKRRMVVCR